jgi:4'-phosphopantetheinyl transferase
LSPSEANKASRFYNELDQRRYALGRSLLRILISIYTEIEPKKIELQTKESGKPYLPKTDLQFSKAASGPFGLVALTLNGEVGVDIEKIQQLDRVSQLVKSGFSTSEHRVFQRIPMSQRDKAFFGGWTRKEAVVKALGTGFALAPDQVIVSLGSSQVYEFKIPSLPSEYAPNWTLLSWSPAAGYQAAIAVRSSNVALSFFILAG